MSQKFALIIGNSDYKDPNLTRLVTPNADVSALAEVLRDPELSNFDEVTPLINQPGDTVRRAIARFFAKKKRDDLLLFYFSGHGVLDDSGQLYLAVKDTESDLLSGTAIPAAFITSQMDRSRSQRQILILDCCHSGAFARGTKGALGASVGTATSFEGTGYGRVVLTASDSTQYAWEGEQVIGDAENSVFTHYLIQGIRTGEADADADGRITLDELYDYVYAQVVSETSKQVPGKWSYKQQGDIIIARNPHPTVKPAELPGELQRAIESPLTGVREGAIRELERLLRGSDKGLALAAQEALKRMVDDDSRRVSEAADKSLAVHAETQSIPVEPDIKTKQPVTDKARTPEWKRQSQIGAQRWTSREVLKKARVWPKIVLVVGVVTLLLGGGLFFLTRPGPEPPEKKSSIETSTPQVKKVVPITPTSIPTPVPTPWHDPISDIDFVWVPEGCFSMGQTRMEQQFLISKIGEEEYQKNYANEVPEEPPHEVCLQGFWMGKYEVTQAQWERVMEENPSSFQYFKRSQEHPVEKVSWDRVQEFLQKLNELAGKEIYRLPSEAEWEYACRAGTQTAYSFGDETDRLAKYGWYSGNSKMQTHRVGQLKPNAFALYDMHGNVWEWCADPWHKKYTDAAPKDGSVWEEGGDTDFRVLRGGSVNYPSLSLRCASRGPKSYDDSGSNIGFRLVCNSTTAN